MPCGLHRWQRSLGSFDTKHELAAVRKGFIHDIRMCMTIAFGSLYGTSGRFLSPGGPPLYSVWSGLERGRKGRSISENSACALSSRYGVVGSLGSVTRVLSARFICHQQSATFALGQICMMAPISAISLSTQRAIDFSLLWCSSDVAVESRQYEIGRPVVSHSATTIYSSRLRVFVLSAISTTFPFKWAAIFFIPQHSTTTPSTASISNTWILSLLSSRSFCADTIWSSSHFQRTSDIVDHA
ncbi:hypothetical protein BDV98DRAFT_277612 [Pterulicium gracile]|uniref:Uncharacterized protein n=1 Tax=Pterulicium gracile TaxID=1884261 RepID=A0A5C3Q668_9AGAR|nr:hypothetical protein BDV98DRAFT_277612 [Pterula gracilis]